MSVGFCRDRFPLPSSPIHSFSSLDHLRKDRAAFSQGAETFDGTYFFR